MPVNKQLYEAMQEKRSAEHHAAERDRRWALVLLPPHFLVRSASLRAGRRREERFSFVVNGRAEADALTLVWIV